MPNLNKVLLMGNLTRDPEVKYTPKGTAVAGFGMAINRQWNNEAGEKMEEVTFVDVEFWGKQGEVIGEYVHKGDPIYAEGRLKLDTWDDKATGQKRSKLRIVGESFQFLKHKEGGGRQPRDEDAPPQARQQQRQTPPPQRKPHDPELEALEEDDIPF